MEGYVQIEEWESLLGILQRGFLEDIRVEKIGVSLPSDQRSPGAVVEGGIARFGAGWKPNWNVAVDAAVGGSGEGGAFRHLAGVGLVDEVAVILGECG